MGNPVQKRNLAYEIGLCRIAAVVDHVDRQIRHHGTLVEFLSFKHKDRRAALTYFWWVVLGGHPLHRTGLPGEHISGKALRDWIAVFPRTALPVIGEDLTRAWMQATERLAQHCSLTENDESCELAEAD